MQFTYRSTLVDSTAGRARNLRTVIDTEKWFEFMRRDGYGLYGNCPDLIEEHILPLLDGKDLEKLYVLTLDLYMQSKQHNSCLVFELAMFVWAGYKEGRYSAEVWAAVFAVAWQSGSRGMMAAVELKQALVIEMFKAAPRELVQGLSALDDEDVNKMYAELDDHVELFRGVSTGLDHFENGFSWTNNPEEAMKFAVLNCQSKKEIPGIVRALVPKSAILAMFSFEDEFVVDPTIPKKELVKHFLRGKELRDFHKKVDVDANTQDVMFRTGYAKRRQAEMFAQLAPAATSLQPGVLSAQVGIVEKPLNWSVISASLKAA